MQVHSAHGTALRRHFQSKKRVSRHGRAGIWMACRMRMHMSCDMRHVPGMLFHAYYFMRMLHGTRQGSAPRFLRTADFGGSQKAMLEPLGSCRGACVSCMHHSSCHDRCACSMACRTRAHGACAESVSAPSPAWQRPARRLRSRLGTLVHMHSFPHAVEYYFQASCSMACGNSVLQACKAR